MLPPVLAKDEVKDLLNGQYDFVGESFDDIQYQFGMVCWWWFMSVYIGLRWFIVLLYWFMASIVGHMNEMPLYFLLFDLF